jgi:hypothetical protein
LFNKTSIMLTATGIHLSMSVPHSAPFEPGSDIVLRHTALKLYLPQRARRVLSCLLAVPEQVLSKGFMLVGIVFAPDADTAGKSASKEMMDNVLSTYVTSVMENVVRTI